MVLEKTLEIPLDSMEIKPFNLKGNQSWIFFGRTDTKALVLWLDAKSQLIWKDPDAGKDWGQVEKGVTEDEMVERHNWLRAYEFEQTLGDGERQGSLACCRPHSMCYTKNQTLLSSWKQQQFYLNWRWVVRTHRIVTEIQAMAHQTWV